VLIAVGAATGFLAGLLGVGGSIIMVPALVAIGYHRHQANAISLATILIVAASGMAAFAASGEVDFRLAVWLGIGGLAGATVGARWMNRLSTPALARIFAVIMLLAGLRMLWGGEVASGEGITGGWAVAGVGLGVGAIAGLASGLAGIGGGVLMVPAMVFLAGTPQHTAEGTSLLAILFTAAAGTRVNAANRHVRWREVTALGLTGALTAPFAARLALALHGDVLRRIFGVFVIVTALRTIWIARGQSS
jgi:uncharacterized membrane protein YfcA